MKAQVRDLGFHRCRIVPADQAPFLRLFPRRSTDGFPACFATVRLNSIVEVGTAVVVIWQFSGADAEREQRALKLIAGSFLVFAAYVAGQAAWDLVARSRPDESIAGIVLAAVSLLVMPVLAIAKRRLGRRMSSRTVVADGGQTMLCSYLSAVLLVGLVANATVGWWWADPIAALVIAGLAVREGREAWRGAVCWDTR